jgi:hypothetical protein
MEYVRQRYRIRETFLFDLYPLGRGVWDLWGEKARERGKEFFAVEINGTLRCPEDQPAIIEGRVSLPGAWLFIYPLIGVWTLICLAFISYDTSFPWRFYIVLMWAFVIAFLVVFIRYELVSVINYLKRQLI